MAKIIFIIIELIVLGISVIMIYDARKIATKTFSSNETNETTKVLKIVGFIACYNKLTNDIYYENKEKVKEFSSKFSGFKLNFPNSFTSL